jgi:hypothetical protein
VSRLGRLRPSPRGLCLALAALGLVSAVALAVVPVDAAFGADPLLRLHGFGNPSSEAASDVSCGAPVSNITHHSDGLSLYGLARDDACQHASSRRLATGVAAGATVAMLALVGLAAAARRPDPVPSARRVA